MARPAMGVWWGGEACAVADLAAERREQAVPEGVLDWGFLAQPDYILWPDCWTMKIQD